MEIGHITVRHEVEAEDTGAAVRLRAWSLLNHLSHEALVKVWDCGTSTQDERATVYCVREGSDAILMDALAEGPLTASEAREATTDVLRALEYVHSRGLVCGSIEPSDVHACGNSTKLFPQSLHEGGTDADRVADLRSVGQLIILMATGSIHGRDAIGDPKLRHLALALLDERSNLTAKAALVFIRPLNISRHNIPMIGVAAVAILVVTLFFGYRNIRRGQPQVIDRTTPVVDPRPSPLIDPDDTSSVREDTTRTRASSAPEPAEITRSAIGEQERGGSNTSSANWAVIAATYKSFSAAQQRASRLKASYGECGCSVYPKEGEGSHYYVIVKPNLTRDAADMARARAIEAGLPGDTYVTTLADRKAPAPSQEGATR